VIAVFKKSTPEDEDSDSDKAAIIAGSVVGSTAFCVLLILAAARYKKRKDAPKFEASPASLHQPSNFNFVIFDPKSHDWKVVDIGSQS